MNSEISFLSAQFRQVYGGDPWYGASVHTILQSFPAAHACDHPIPEVHSAAELVAHIIAYRHFLNNRLGNDDDFPPDQEATFNWKAITKSQPDAWESLLEQLAVSQEQLLDLLSRQDDALLDERVSGKSYDFRYLIYGVLQHDIYHLGQILYITRFYQEQDKSNVTVHKSSFLPDLSECPLKEKNSYQLFSYEGLAYSK